MQSYLGAQFGSCPLSSLSLPRRLPRHICYIRSTNDNCNILKTRRRSPFGIPLSFNHSQSNFKRLDIKMMGSPYYYNITYVPSDMAISEVFHDCMWSGVCACCPEAELHGTTTVVVKPMNRCPTEMQESTIQASMQNTPSGDEQVATNRNQVQTTISHQQSTYIAQEENKCIPRHLKGTKDVPSKLTNTIITSNNSNANVSNKSSKSNKLVPTGDFTMAAKKLRHREVEKNRHRQLQAMVKTLSERIPGRVDKETQVQTMRRAARYCVFLRDVLAAAAHSQMPMNRDRLEKIYLRSCDTVDNIHVSE